MEGAEQGRSPEKALEVASGDLTAGLRGRAGAGCPCLLSACPHRRPAWRQ